MSGRSVGIDVGGTYTDLVAINEAGQAEARKVLSTPSDQSAGVLAALDALGGAPKSLERLVHGTTVATNMLLERTGARVTLCASEGATDLLDLRRQERASLYDLTRHHPAALVPPERRTGVPGRVASGGRNATARRGGGGRRRGAGRRHEAGGGRDRVAAFVSRSAARRTEW